MLDGEDVHLALALGDCDVVAGQQQIGHHAVDRCVPALCRLALVGDLQWAGAELEPQRVHPSVLASRAILSGRGKLSPSSHFLTASCVTFIFLAKYT